MSEKQFQTAKAKGLPQEFIDGIKRRNKSREAHKDGTQLILFPWHQTVFKLFGLLQTQWRTDFGQRTGLDYSVLPVLFESLAIDNDPSIDGEVLIYDINGEPSYVNQPKTTLIQQLQIIEQTYLQKTRK